MMFSDRVYVASLTELNITHTVLEDQTTEHALQEDVTVVFNVTLVIRIIIKVVLSVDLYVQ